MLVRHYDRLWRTAPLQSQISALCLQHRCQVYSLTQPKEPLDPDKLPKRRGLSAVVEGLSGWLSEEEQNIRVARHRAGMAGRIARGLHHPGQVVPYGYMWGPDGLLVPNPAEAEWVRWIFQRRLEGQGYRGIAVALGRLGVPVPSVARPERASKLGGPWYETSVRRILRNPVYAGRVRWGRYEAEGQHEGLVSPADFARVQEIAAEHSFFRHAPKYTGNWLAGLLRCGLCGSPMRYYARKAQGASLYLRCALYARSRRVRCSHNGHTAAKVHSYVLSQMYWALSEPTAYEAARAAQRNEPELAREAEALRAALADIEARLSRAWHAYEVGAISLDDWLGHRSRIEAEAAAVQPRLREVERVLAAPAPEIGDEYREALEFLFEAPAEDLRKLARALIHDVVLVKGQEPEIRWL